MLNTVASLLFSGGNRDLAKNKPALTPAQMVNLLVTRGMIVPDKARAEEFLERVNYYKLRGYFIPFETYCPTHDHRFLQRTTFEEVLALYRFDRKLRLLFCDMLERFEVAVRTKWAQEISQKHGPDAHLHPRFFIDDVKHTEMLDKLEKAYQDSKEQFATHYRNRYKSLRVPPVWVSAELMSFGMVSHWLKATRTNSVQNAVSSSFGFEPKFFQTFVHQAVVIRNRCSHHSRLWNWASPVRLPAIRTGSTQFDVSLLNSRPADITKVYNFVAILLFVADRVAPGHKWGGKLYDFLCAEQTRLPNMGFPRDWYRAFGKSTPPPP